MIRRFLFATGLVAASLACAEASAPLPPPEEVLLVVSQAPARLLVIPVDAPTSGTAIPLGGTAPTPTGVSARNGVAVVPMGDEDSLVVIDLRAGSVSRAIGLTPGSGATGSAIIDDSIAYVANPKLNSVTRVNYLTGDTASVAVGVWPQGMVFTRGRLFVFNGNLVAGTPAGPSWVSVVDPETNRLAAGVDSILMPGPGNATFGDVAQDGVLYVINRGPDDGVTAGRLSLIDPVGRTELGSFGGFGAGPGAIASDGADRLYLSSRSEGVMLFDLVARQVLRGAGNGVPIGQNSSVAVGSNDRVWAIESGACTPGATGSVHILRRNLTEIRSIPGGECPVAALVTEIPPQ